MEIRPAKIKEKDEIVALYKRSQYITGLPDPKFVPPDRLGDRLYARNAIGRFVATETGSIVGHGLIETANPDHLPEWLAAVGDSTQELIELGGAFVEPSKIGQGIWSMLLRYRIDVVRSMGALPVSVTWSVNTHVKRRFLQLGGIEVVEKQMEAGTISLFIL